MKYEINKNFIPGLPQTPYDQGIGAYLGVVAHSTGNYGNPNDPDSSDGERIWEVRDWRNAFVHFFVDWNKIMQVADTDYICFGSGHTGNHAGYVQIELCQTEEDDKFLVSYDRYVWLLAYILFQKKLTVRDGLTLISHANISNTYHESDHQDPIEYLESHGKTWDNVVSDVTKYYKEMENKSMISPISQVKTLDEAIDLQVKEGIINSPEYREKVCDTTTWEKEYVIAVSNKIIEYKNKLALAQP